MSSALPAPWSSRNRGPRWRSTPADKPRRTLATGATDEETDRRQVDLLVNALDTGGDTLLTARQGRHIVATVAAALQSARTGHPCQVTRPG